MVYLLMGASFLGGLILAANNTTVANVVRKGSLRAKKFVEEKF